MKCILLILIFFTGQAPISAGGFSTWEYVTPEGNTLYYDDTYYYDENIKKEKGTRIFCRQMPYPDLNAAVLNNIVEWYYQPGYVIGTFSDGLYSTARNRKAVGYFLFEEGQCKVTIFQDEISWKIALSAKGLIPVLWKKSHTRADYSIFGYKGDDYFLVYLLFTVLVELINLIYFAVNRFKPWKQFTVASLVICTLLLLVYWWHIYPYGL